VLGWLREESRPFALSGDWLGMPGITVIGGSPLVVADPAHDDPFELLERQPAVEVESGSGASPVLVGGGWVGWLGYRLGALIERLPPGPSPAVGRPAYSLAFYDHVLVHDGERWWFEMLWSAEREAELAARLELWRERLAGVEPVLGDGHRALVGPLAPVGDGAAGHLAAVADCVERIGAGELFQANICLRLEGQFDGDPIDLFAAALPQAQPRFGALIDGVLSLSPERFLRRRGRRVWTEPIKGTRPRTGDATDRADARAALIESGKDAAEHVMIVDLMRNDLGRVSVYGTVSAEPSRVEPHAGVWHLVSTVSGTLRDDVGDGSLLRATFPPGSVTGAPKVQAMKVIAALESSPRDAYTGAIGIASPVAGLDLSVAIRTFETDGRSIWLGVGGGIVAESSPVEELQEALAKAAGPVAAVGGSLVASSVRPPAQQVIRERGNADATTFADDPLGRRIDEALGFGFRPDPGLGVFETVLAERGEVVLLEPHLERLVASCAELYEMVLDVEELRGRVLATVAGADVAARERGRIRVLADPNGAIEVTVVPEAPAPSASGSEPAAGVSGSASPPLELVPYLLPGGLGARKWRDRRLLEALVAQRPGTVPLLVGGDGLVLEAGHANVWIVEDGQLLTPPADGRILAGVTRAQLLSGGDAREAEIDLARLAGAEAVFLTSAISGRREGRLASG
jgi:para-aminobenzoate synthetase / 4-amino-4-deoxychorismate lyase